MGTIRNKLITKLLAGFILGIAIGAVFWILNGRSLNDKELFLQLLASGLFGMFPMGGSIVYQIESWGLWRSTFVHYLVSLGAFLIVSLVMDWFYGSILLIAAFVYTDIYAVIWVTESLYWRKTVEELNDELNSFKQDSDGAGGILRVQ